MWAVNEVISASHGFVSQVVFPGDQVVDGTAGNGNDTLFLAGLVGPEGLVHAFDVQQQALDKTQDLLEKNSLSARVQLHLANHREIPNLVTSTKAIMFNLGYLPGGDKSVITKTENTLLTLKGCLDVLSPGGIITIVTYSGHPGGMKEQDVVASFCTGLNPRFFSALGYSFVNRPNNPPKLWLIKKTVQ